MRRLTRPSCVRLLAGVALASVAFALACAEGGEAPYEDFVIEGHADAPHDAGSAPSADASAAEVPALAVPEAMPRPSGCRAPAGVSNAPRSIEEAVRLMNSLERPVSLPCFVRSLARPLEIYATSSSFSAQPAAGTRSPRVFLFIGDALILSVVPDGSGRDLLEASQLTTPTRSVKAEIPFPLTEELTTDDVVEHIARGASEASICRLCHASEVPAGDRFYAGALESDALRPTPSYDVSVEAVLAEHLTCDPELEPRRCEVLSSLFDHGEVGFRAFPAEMRTFF